MVLITKRLDTRRLSCPGFARNAVANGNADLESINNNEVDCEYVSRLVARSENGNLPGWS